MDTKNTKIVSIGNGDEFMKKYFFLLFALSINTAFSQEKLSLSLQESIEIGLKNNYAIHTSRLKVDYAEEKITEAEASRLPSLKLNASYSRLSPVDPFVINLPGNQMTISPNIENSYNVRVSLQQPIFTGFRINNAANLAEANYNASINEQRKDQQDVILNISQAYWNLAKAKKLKEVVEKNISQIEAHLTDIRNLMNQELATKNDLLKVQVQYSEAKLRLIDVNNNIRLANLALNNLLNIEPGIEVDAKEDFTKKLDKIENLDVYINTAANNRSEIKSLQSRLEANKALVNISKSNYYPQIFLGANYLYANPNQRYFPMQEKFKGTWDVGVSLNYDIWNWGSTASQVEQANIQMEQLKDNMNLVQDVIVLEVNQAYLNLKQAEERIEASKINVEHASENYRVTQERFKEGLTLSSELLDAETLLLQAEINSINAQIDYQIASAKLKRSIEAK